MKEFKNKKVLITGASKGLGREISKEFDRLGSTLILIARSEKLLNSIVRKSKNKRKHQIFSVDLFDGDNLKKTINTIKKRNKRIDIIIHCIGGSFGINEPLENWKKFNKCLMGNIGIAIEINSQFIPLMIKKKSGNIIHVSSITGLEAIGSIPYVTSKAALSGYVRTMGNFLAKHGIILSGIIPGAFIGHSNAMGRFKFYKPDQYRIFKKNLPQSRMPSAKEYLEIIKHLSSKRSKIFSGSFINLDAGQGKTIL